MTSDGGIMIRRGTPGAVHRARSGGAHDARPGTLRAAILALVAGGLLSIPAPPPAAAVEPGYLTLLFGRSQWVSTEGCSAAPNTVDLGQVADELSSRGLTGTGAVVTNQTLETGRHCFTNLNTYANWQDLANLRDNHGWSFISSGKSHQDITQMTPEAAYDESCGSLDALRAHGHDRGHGLFGYPNDKWTPQIQTDIVSTCFAYGRKYVAVQSPSTNDRGSMGPPWFQWTNSINGGNCNDVALPCYAQPGMSRRYTSPLWIANTLMTPGPDQWTVVQVYRFVTDAHTGPAGSASWDCTSPNWEDHWSSRAELYCWEDFKTALDGIPANGVIVTDPLAVAEAWGRYAAPQPPTFDSTLGGPNHAETYPGGIEVLPDGSLIVADTGNNAVEKFAPDGSLAWRVGDHGGGVGQFLFPRDLGVDSQGYIYVVDTGNNRVVKLDGAGNWVTSWTGPAGDLMSSPLGITVTADRVYVADSGRKKVRVFATDGTQLVAFGSSGACTMGSIRDVDADSAGNVYVANYDLNNILKMTAAGGCIMTWGSQGTGNGQFRIAYGLRVATDPVLGQEAVFVADANNGRIQEFRTDGTFVTKFGTLGPAAGPLGTFFQLRRVAVAADGDVWGADMWGWRLQRFDRRPWGYPAAQIVGAPLPAPTDTQVFHEPRGIGFEADGTVVVADTVHHTVVRMSPSGQLLSICGGRGASLGTFNWPRGVAVDPVTGSYWVADTKQHRLQIIRPDCSGVKLLGTYGSGQTQFNWPYSIAIRASDRIAWIADTYNHRIKAYKVATRSPISSFGTKGSALGRFNQPSGIAVHPLSGHVFVADTNNNRIVELSDTGGSGISVVRNLMAGFSLPQGVAVDTSGRIYVADTGNSRVVILRPDGSVLTSFTLPDGFDQPENVAVDSSGRIYVADTYNDRIQVYAPYGT